MPPARLPEHFHWLTVQRYNKKQLFAIVCSDFVLKSAHIFNIYTEDQVVTKPLNISHLKKESYTPKIGVCVFYTYTATYSTVSCHSWPVSLNKSFYKWTNSRKMYYLCRRKAALGNLKASFHCARLHFLCTVNQWKCYKSLAGGIYYDQGWSQ